MPIWADILIGVGSFAIAVLAFFGGGAYFQARAKHAADKKNAAEDAKEAEEAEKQQKLDELEQNEIMNNLAETLAGILVPKFKEMMSEELAPIKAGVQATCRYDLDELTSKADAQGWLSQYDKDRYKQMYTSYHNLGENGVMDAAFKRITALPNRPPQKPKRNSRK